LCCFIETIHRDNPSRLETIHRDKPSRSSRQSIETIHRDNLQLARKSSTYLGLKEGLVRLSHQPLVAPPCVGASGRVVGTQPGMPAIRGIAGAHAFKSPMHHMFCKSHRLSRFAALFNDPKPKTSIAKGCSDSAKVPLHQLGQTTSILTWSEHR
jgi:hypothetical protein